MALESLRGASAHTGRHDFAMRLCYVLLGIVLLTLCVENFVFSDRLGLLVFRELDDLAFQEVLRRLHSSIHGGDYAKLLAVNDYAYGWIFWVPMALLTYPLYLLNMHWALDWPLIVAPRQISLVFSILSLLVLRKILKGRNVPEWACAAALLIFSLCPTFGYFSLRFGTVNAVMFFSLLSFYLAQKDTPSSAKGRAKVALALALAGGIKLSGLLILPFVGACVMVRLNEKNRARMLAPTLMPALLFICALVVFTNPALLTLPFNAEAGADYWKTLQYFIGLTKTALDAASPLERFFNGAFGDAVNGLAFACLLGGFFFCRREEGGARFDILFAAAILIVISCYLILSVRSATGIGSYFTAVSFLFLLGVAGWARTRAGFPVLMSLSFLLLVNAAARAREQSAQEGTESSIWNHFFYFVKLNKSNADLASAEQVEQCLGLRGAKDWGGQLFIDYTIPLAFNSLGYPKACVSRAWNNLSPSGKYCERPVDYLVLDKAAIGAMPGAQFEQRLRAVDVKTAEGLLRDRASRIALATSGVFGAQRFAPVCERGRIQVYQAVE